MLQSLAAATGSPALSTKALRETVQILCGPELATVLSRHFETFAAGGLDALSAEEIKRLREDLSHSRSPFAVDVLQWLNGKYIFGFEGMIDQSCYDGT